ncbi:MAG: hypothetical protein M1826_000396 [Phylliscum demangeonii]|nr:MAG: hypothetical protein M1826_000396 [Phylliscum demangeonii]
MPDVYTTHLAASILSDRQVVTYRSLSRALKVHVNHAKEMLYDFHQKQNAWKVHSVHATYLITGIRKPSLPVSMPSNGAKDGEDVIMQSSPFLSSSMPPEESADSRWRMVTMCLVREEDLEQVRASFEKITSVHVYSLQPHALKDLNVLSNANREVYEQYMTEDPLKVGRQYGTIVNPNARRRPARVPTTVPAPAAAKPLVAATASARQAPRVEPTEAPVKSNSDHSTVKGEQPAKAPPSAPHPRKAATHAGSKPPALKRGASDLFKAFAKSKPPKPPKPREETDTAIAVSGSPSAPEDEPMKDVSDDEADDDDEPDLMLRDGMRSAAEIKAAKTATLDRAEQLRRMMDVDDDNDNDNHDADEPTSPHEDSPSSQDHAPEPDSNNHDDEEERSQTAPDLPLQPPQPPPPGRQRVMKKIVRTNEEGYQITSYEPTWEPIPERKDPPPIVPPHPNPKPKLSTTPTTTTTAAAAARPRKGAAAAAAAAAKAGQGSIQSFFSSKKKGKK